MKQECPVCGKTEEWEQVTTRENFEVRGENIPVEFSILRCPQCQTEFDNLGSDIDPYALAYEEYRKRKGMVHPNQIKEFRKKYDLTQKELSNLLGVGEITLSRYENGALQDEAHDRLLKFIFEPSNLFFTIQEKENVISDEKKRALLPRLRYETDIESFLRFYTNQKPDIFSGNKMVDLEKVVDMIRFFTYSQSIFKTKLLKLMFYADFKFFKDFNQSITGLRYEHYTFGPVPYHFIELIGVALNIDANISIEERGAGDYTGEVIISANPPSSNLSQEEITTLREVQDHFASFTSREIVNYAHREKGFMQTKDRELISYEYAKELQI
ncbi:MAG TPA: hypothetical protein DCK95_05110 [Anaerolineaceae bacterium]|nr:hypothetical protein [Anaerolineaceae bacterium]